MDIGDMLAAPAPADLTGLTDRELLVRIAEDTAATRANIDAIHVLVTVVVEQIGPFLDGLKSNRMLASMLGL